MVGKAVNKMMISQYDDDDAVGGCLVVWGEVAVEETDNYDLQLTIYPGHPPLFCYHMPT